MIKLHSIHQMKISKIQGAQIIATCSNYSVTQITQFCFLSNWTRNEVFHYGFLQ